MADPAVFSAKDHETIQLLGMSATQLLAQIDLFRKGAPYLKLKRACILGDGIKMLSAQDVRNLSDAFPTLMRAHRCLKFVPASGAASRMFKSLQTICAADSEIGRDAIARKAGDGSTDSREVLRFVDHIHRFAFFDDLSRTVAEHGERIEDLIARGRFRAVFNYLLEEDGLSYANLPKGLLLFHRYEDEYRTAFAEHLVEAVGYAGDSEQVCRLHFTVSPEHVGRFEKELEKIRPFYETKLRHRFQITFSVQDPSTDTLAVDMENNPFRLDDGTLFFRPAGHGALIENLSAIQGDVVWIKNIDNVVPDSIKDQTWLWKRALGTLLVKTQARIFYYLDQMAKWPVSEKLLDEALEFCMCELGLVPSQKNPPNTVRKKKKFLIRKLNRPLRVCGMVRNRGAVGGGPFWVQNYDGTQSLQIVEAAQINTKSETQQAILKSSTHFNPVDIVCGLRNWCGYPFDLRHFIYSEAVFISIKSKDGRELKTLERPGLWNGSMADWNTIFVEVPEFTFNPVKTVNDLLRSEHQASSRISAEAAIR